MSKLLRLANRFIRNNLQDDDSPSGPTPTGITTPQMDLSEKHQTPIMHNNLQVGPPGPTSTASFPLPDTVAAMDSSQLDAHITEVRDDQSSSGRSSVSSDSLIMMSGGGKSSGLPDKMPQVSEARPDTLSPAKSPTPPHCSVHSLLQKETYETDTASTVPGQGMSSSIFTALKNYLPVPPGNVSISASATRRQVSHPISSISDNTVLASHFSNPCLPSLCSPEALSLDHDKPLPRVSMSSENLARLTLNDSSPPKNTPPLTPRAMSSDGSQPDKKPVTSAPQASEPADYQQTDDMTTETEEITGKLNEAFPSGNSTRSSSPQSSSQVGSLKGKLFVTIREARGLRPGFDPYVVCVFESNEVISKSAHDEEEASIERQKKEQEKSDLEAGRPMAIPMKSRQSSSNSLPSLLDEQNAKNLITDPHWNHEAVLYVVLCTWNETCMGSC